MDNPTVGTRVTDGTRTGRIVRIDDDRPFGMDYLVRWGREERGTYYAAHELTAAPTPTRKAG